MYRVPCTWTYNLSFHCWKYPYANSLHCCWYLAFLDHVSPCQCSTSSCHLLLRLPLDLFPFLTCHSVRLTVHLLSFMRAILVCPAYFLFDFVMTFKISSTFVWSYCGILYSAYACFNPSIFLSIFSTIMRIYKYTLEI